MMEMFVTRFACLISGTALGLALTVPVHAQAVAGDAADSGGELIVTARKRDETAISVPVAITAVSRADLDRRGVNSIDDLAQLVPQLISGKGGTQGGTIVLRGMSGADGNPFSDQAVSFNIDGMQVARASVRRMGQFDLDQVEVLKGPQTLFFGKNSPGGIISMRTADPTRHFEAQVSTGYEINAHEWREEGYVSTPLTDTLGLRIAGYNSDMRGWVYNTTPVSSGYAPSSPWGPDTHDYDFRGTLRWQPSADLNARLKLSYGHVSGQSELADTQFVNCPTGSPQTGGADDCKADNQVSVGEIGSKFAAVDPRLSGPTGMYENQALASLEVNYTPSKQIALTSVTGFYSNVFQQLGDFTASYVPADILASWTRDLSREFTQELRLATNFDFPVNFTTGGFYQHSYDRVEALSYYNADSPTYSTHYLLGQVGNAYSAFLQARWTIVRDLELSGGGRFSSEEKSLPTVQAGRTLVDIVPAAGSPRHGNWDNFSPEATLTWHPTRRVTAYGSYKQGFLSGGFNATVATSTSNLEYNPQVTKGFEGGIKAELLDGRLYADLALYSYKTYGLQVTTTTNGTIQELRNAGEARSRGAELNLTYRTPVRGLSLNGALAYDQGTFEQYFASCYRGETAPTCTNRINPQTGQTALLQNLSGTQLPRAPTWAGNVGAIYERPVSETLKAMISGNLTFSDSYLTDYLGKEFARSPAYQLIDVTLGIGRRNDGWKFEVIGRNLGDAHYWTRASDNPFSGTAPGGATGTRGDTIAAVSQGRQVMMRLTARFH
jgi:iron complex outermembrane recepter protein